MANPNPNRATEAHSHKRRILREKKEELADVKARADMFITSEELDGMKDDIVDLESSLKRVKDKVARSHLAAEIEAQKKHVADKEAEERERWDQTRAPLLERIAQLERDIEYLERPVDHNEARRMRRAYERMVRVTKEIEAQIERGELKVYGPFGEDRAYVVLTKEQYDDGIRCDSMGHVDEPSTPEFRAKYYPEQEEARRQWEEKFDFVSTSFQTATRHRNKWAVKHANDEEDLLLAETGGPERSVHDDDDDWARKMETHERQVRFQKTRVEDSRRALAGAEEGYKEAKRRLDLFIQKEVYIGHFRGEFVNEETGERRKMGGT